MLRQWWEHLCVLFTFQNVEEGVWAGGRGGVCPCAAVTVGSPRQGPQGMVGA